MNFAARLDATHSKVKSNKWFLYFARFNRIALAAGFIPSGFTKIFDERFTSLSSNHPMGNYLEALYHTGYYYHFIGYVQVLAAFLLLIPRTATLGALIYFPVILNICILSLAVGFDGSLISSPLMVCANLYLICWDYDKIKNIFPFAAKAENSTTSSSKPMDNKFPKKFFLGVAATVAIIIVSLNLVYEKRPRNNFAECISDCKDSDNSENCFNFCACIHKEGNSFDKCSEEYKKAKKQAN